MPIDPTSFAALCAVALVAGCMDAIAGGGGLLTVPALIFAGLDPRAVLATNKLQGSFGTASATSAFARAGHLPLGSWPFALAAAAGSVVGALTLDHVPQRAVSVALPFVLLGVALYFALSPRFSDAGRHHLLSRPAFLATVVPLVGFYDGVFGPGAGSFYMAGLVAVLGFGVLRATAHTKLCNLASNLAGLATLALGGHVIWALGLAMGLAQFAGAQVGARLAMRHGARLVKPLIVAISLVLAAKLALTPGHPIHDAIFAVR
ncbi:TSUP family transporter [Lichenibacterium dinghuense]|uniref:TSUP family transporter n=1 Tax=Lichenibacterium dinghuense TaxID=2895977 RepID=UPI001F02ACB7|nr:TSUP family transporter [Lichenibacterium sp. 6Y81]